MSCCESFSASKASIEDVVKAYHPLDYKIFIVHRGEVEGITYKVRIGVVVKPDVEKNSLMFEDFIKLTSSNLCIKVLTSDINFKDEKLVDLFLLEIESEVS